MRNIKSITLLLLANLAVLGFANAQSEKSKSEPAQTEIKKNTSTQPHATNAKKRIPPTPKNQSAVIHSDQTREVKKEDESKRSGELHSEPMTSPK